MTSLVSSVKAEKVYFDLSKNEVDIDTNFKGQELILFGLTEPNHDIVVVVRGPKKELTIRKKKRILGFWINTKSVTYIDIPKVYFIASSSNIEKLLDENQRYLNQIGFSNIKFIPKKDKDIFLDTLEWNKSLIRIQKNNNLYKKFKLDIIDDKLFQTRLYFPTNIPMGKYIITTYMIKSGTIENSNKKTLLINKSGIGNQIFMFAQEKKLIYGIGTIIIALILGSGAAVVFRKL
tara:strand:+ start:328 stop:1029 length:702 start_codon:yes stop_codon:yes gene_type:complete